MCTSKLKVPTMRGLLVCTGEHCVHWMGVKGAVFRVWVWGSRGGLLGGEGRRTVQGIGGSFGLGEGSDGGIEDI